MAIGWNAESGSIGECMARGRSAESGEWDFGECMARGRVLRVGALVSVWL